MIECVPNFSEGRDPNRIDALLHAANGVPGAWVLGHHSDADHNRTVITLAGAPDAVAEAALRTVGKAAELIDLTEHAGVHPRIGATDVLPFIPMEDHTMEDCVVLAHRVGREIWKRYKIPVYFYEAAAMRVDRKNLAVLRTGQFEGLRDEIATKPERAPDIGNAQLHPTAGAIAVGARKFLIAFNLLLSTREASVAKQIARTIRASSGGLPFVKAMGLYLPSRGLAQVSMNLTDFEETPIQTVFAAVARETEKYNCEIVSSELVGLIPRKALEGTSSTDLLLEKFSPSMILEERLAEVRANSLKQPVP